MTGFQRGASTINRKSGLKWGVLEKNSALKVRLYSLASENSQKPAKKTNELCTSATDCNGISVTERSFRAILRGLGWWKSFCS